MVLLCIGMLNFMVIIDILVIGRIVLILLLVYIIDISVMLLWFCSVLCSVVVDIELLVVVGS